MSERYSKVFTLSENLYATGSPIAIEAGALQKDNQTGGILAQIKMKNISVQVVKAVKVKLTLFDVAGNILANGVEQQYLDLRVVRDESFGSKSAIKLKESTTRSFTVNIVEVVFEDGNVWKGTTSTWETLSKQTALITYFNDEELVKQYEIKNGSPCHNVLLEEKDLWYCTCGALNRDNEEKCHKCGKSLKALKELDISALKAEKEKRLEQERILAEEKAERERQEAEIAEIEAEAKRRRSKKIAAIVVPIVCILIVGVVGFIYINNNILIPNGKYNDAVALMDSGKYEEAVALFEELAPYKDSSDLYMQAKYEYANQLMGLKEYHDAMNILQQLGTYKDSMELLKSVEIKLDSFGILYDYILQNGEKYEDDYITGRAIEVQKGSSFAYCVVKPSKDERVYVITGAVNGNNSSYFNLMLDENSAALDMVIGFDFNGSAKVTKVVNVTLDKNNISNVPVSKSMKIPFRPKNKPSYKFNDEYTLTLDGSTITQLQKSGVSSSTYALSALFKAHNLGMTTEDLGIK